jgi:phage baseplate assembly protein V
VIRTVNKLLAPLRNQLANLVARAVVQLVNDGAKLQLVQLGVLEGETREGCERFQEYGFTSVPHPGAEAVVLFVGGRRDHGLVVAVDDRRYRKKDLAPGESAIYSDEGDYVVLKRGRIVEVKAGAKLLVDAPELELGGGTMQPAALATALRTELDAIWTALGAHVHAGVTAGSAMSGTAAVVATKQTVASAAVQVRV